MVDVEAVLPAGGMPIAQQITPVGTDFTVTIEGNVAAVDTTARTLTVSADDDDQSGAQLTVSVPDSFDLTAIKPGDEVELLVALHSDGTFTLLGLAGDDNAREGDDQGEQQGEPCDGHHGDQGGDGGHQGEQGDDHGDDGGDQSGGGQDDGGDQ
jgi:hypothetical protein